MSVAIRMLHELACHAPSTMLGLRCMDFALSDRAHATACYSIPGNTNLKHVPTRQLDRSLKRCKLLLRANRRKQLTYKCLPITIIISK